MNEAIRLFLNRMISNTQANGIHVHVEEKSRMTPSIYSESLPLSANISRVSKSINRSIISIHYK